MYKTQKHPKLCLFFLFLILPKFLLAEDVYPSAILNFTGKGVPSELSDTIQLLLIVNLSTSENLVLLERDELDKVIKELELNKSGLVSQSDMIQVGKFVGAKLIVTGTMFEVDSKCFIVAKIISTETTKFLGVSVSGKKDMEKLTAELSKKIIAEIKTNGKNIVAKEEKQEDIITGLKNELNDLEKPVISIKISEKSYMADTIDPAAETEFAFIYNGIKGKVVEKNQDNNKPDYRIEGEGFSEYSVKVGKLVCVKSRLEVKVIDKNNQIVSTDRQVVWQTDTAERVAGKASLQKAAQLASKKIILDLVKHHNANQTKE